MTVSDEKLVAFMDGELPDAELATVGDAIAASPDLVQRMELLQGADEKFRKSFAAMDARPIRTDTIDLIKGAAKGAADLDEKAGENTENIIAFKARPRPSINTTGSRWMPQAIAATIALVVGFGGGAFIYPDMGSGPDQAEASRGGTIYQTAGLIDVKSPLFAVLETGQSASTVPLPGENEGSVTPVSTFKTHSQGYCREFELQTSDANSRNIACRNEASWTIVASMLQPKTSTDNGTNFTTATGMSPELIDTMILKWIEGDILDKDDEAKLIAKSWK